MENDGYVIKVLDRTHLVSNIDEIIKLDRICYSEEMGYPKIYEWTKENFLHELPRKWELSCVTLYENENVGYLITSYYDYDDLIFFHRMSIHPEHKRKGLGESMFNFSIGQGLKYSPTRAVWEFEAIDKLIKHYTKMGCRPLPKQQTLELLTKKNKLDQKETYKNINKDGYRWFVYMNLGGE